MRPDELAESARLAAKHHRQYPPPYAAVVVDRSAGQLRGVVPNPRTWNDLRALIIRASAPRRIASTPRSRRAGRRPRRVVASRDGPSEPSDEPPLVAPIRGFAPANVRMVRHLERRRAKAAAA